MGEGCGQYTIKRVDVFDYCQLYPSSNALQCCICVKKKVISCSDMRFVKKAVVTNLNSGHVTSHYIEWEKL